MEKKVKLSYWVESRTAGCVVCGIWQIVSVCGHVHKDGKYLLASKCKKHRGKMAPYEHSCMGCYGDWKPFMGYAEDYEELDKSS